MASPSLHQQLHGEIELVDKLGQAIKLTQKLRATVSKVFEDLGNGLENTQGNEKIIINGLQKTLLAVNNDFSELEKVGSGISKDHSNTVANTSHLTFDPSLDKAPLYSDVLHWYKWTNKLTDYTSHANLLLNQNSLKRSPLAHVVKPKRLRRPIANHAFPTQQIDQVIHNLTCQFSHMKIECHRPYGTSTVMLITLRKTLKAMVVLRGLVIEWVRVKAYSEDFFQEDGKLDVWSKTRYKVFQKVTEHSCGAILHFCHALIPDLTIKSFLTWLNSYHSLFSLPCSKCGKHLLDGCPPTFRDMRTCVPLHELCRQ